MADVTVVPIGNLKGPKGEPGTFESASAEPVSFDEPDLTPVISGERGEHVHFKVPRGLPAPLAVPSDTAVATYVAAPDTLTGQALLARHPLVRVWDGAEYPDPVPGATHFFLGPVNPGTKMGEGDYWWRTDGVPTLDDIAAAIDDTSSRLHEAVANAGQSRVFVAAEALAALNTGGTDDRPVPWKMWTASQARNAVPVWVLPDGAPTPIGTAIAVPPYWDSARVTVWWMHNTDTATGVVRIGMGMINLGAGDLNLTADDPDPGVVEQAMNLTVPSLRQQVVRTDFTAALPVDGGIVRVYVQRSGSHADDTFTGDIGVIGIELVRAS